MTGQCLTAFLGGLAAGPTLLFLAGILLAVLADILDALGAR